eukprot:snap_masked-scaffold_60-processed-gene-0.24-mRNA-1 protein AED:1.00 eAED:1.00 QI:0/0/0/0/1/1/2/0/73
MTMDILYLLKYSGQGSLFYGPYMGGAWFMAIGDPNEFNELVLDIMFKLASYRIEDEESDTVGNEPSFYSNMIY